MITSEILSAVFAAQDGNLNATQMLYNLVENPESDKCSIEELCQKLTLSYDLLITLINLSETQPNEILIEFLQKSVGNVTKEKYLECVNILRFYGYTLLVKFVEKNWHLIPENLKIRCKYDIESLFSYNRSDSTILSEYTSLVNQKASQYISTIAVREWPNEWKEFIPLCINSLNQLFTKLGSECKNNKQALNEISVFWGVISEISVEIKDCLDETILYKRRIQISNVLKAYIYDIFVTIHRVIVLGVVSSNEQLSYMIINIFRNLSSILDGFIFISFDIDDFLKANVNSVKTSDVIQTISNICLDVCHKKIKNLTVIPEFDLSNEQLYKVKLDRFIKNLVLISECFSVDFDYTTTLHQLQVAQAFRNLLDKNSVYLIENVPPETLSILFEYLIIRMVMHPSIEVSTCALNSCSLLLRRILSMKIRKTEDIAQKLLWLDHKKFLLCLFIRGLKLGNPAVSEVFFAQARDMASGPGVNMFSDLCILDPVISNITNHFKGTYDWINALFNYCPIDEEISVGQMKNFEARFAALRSTILHCCSLVSIISPMHMNTVLMVIGDLLTNLSKELVSDCLGYCRNYRKNERHLNYVCSKYILFDGILFVFESTIFRLRSNTIDLNGNTTNNNMKDEKMYWLSVDLYKGLVLDLNNLSIPLMIQDYKLNWIRTSISLLLNLVGLTLNTSHKCMLDIRRLDSLASMSILFLYNGQFVGTVLEFIVGKILYEINNNISNLNKCALQSLTVFCKNCKKLIGPYLEVIVSKVHQCLSIVTNDTSKDLLLESLVSLITTNANNLNSSMVNDIMVNYVNQLKLVNQVIATNSSNEILWDKMNSTNAVVYSENLYNYLFKADSDTAELNRRNLHRTVTMCYSIVKKLPRNARPSFGDMNVAGVGMESNMGLGSQLYKYSLNILFSFINFWKVDFFNNDSLRKALLSPGKDEWLSLQGFNEAIANEDNLEQIVESVFNIPKTENSQNIRSIRRYIYILRQSLLKLMGLLIHASATGGTGVSLTSIMPGPNGSLNGKLSCFEVFESTLVDIIEWVPVFHLYQIIKYTLVPCIFSLSKLNVILNRLQERINQEWKSLNLFKVTNNSTAGNGHFKEREDQSVESKVIHLYYLKVYACIDCGIEILNMCLRLINNKHVKQNNSLDNDKQEDMIKEDVMRDDSIDTDMGDSRTELLNDEELIHAILSCLCSALSWPHLRTINESLRIMRIYARVTPSLNVQLHIKFIYQLILYLNKHIIVPKTFNPLEIGDSALSISSSNELKGNSHIKEYVNTICTLYESLPKCFPQILSVVNEDDINVQELLAYQQVVETLKLLTPYLQEQDCLLFIKYILLQKSLNSRSLLKNSIQDKLKVNNYNVYLLQFNKSSLETKSSSEIEIHESDTEEDPILGNDILYLLLE